MLIQALVDRTPQRYGRKFVLVTFTAGHANERGIIPSVARTVIAGLRRAGSAHGTRTLSMRFRSATPSSMSSALV